MIQPDQLQEIKDIIEMKVSHRKNINRRKEKFGYDSNSLIGLNMTGILMNTNKPKFLKNFENI